MKNKTKEQLIREISSLRKQIIELKKSGVVCTLMEKQCQELISKGKDVIFSLDIDGNITFVSPIVKTILGYKQEDLIGKNFRIFVPEEDEKKIEENFNALLKKGEFATELPFPGKNGENHYFECTATVIKKGKKILGIRGIARDVTKRKQMEVTLLESEAKFRSVVDNIAIGVSLISPKMEILALNKKMKEWFSDVDINKKPICYRAFNNPPREKICSYCPTYKTLNDGQVHESVTDTPAGDKIINFRVVSSPITHKSGKVIAAIEMVEDITERQKIDEKLKTYQENLEELVEKRTYEFEMVNKKLQQDIAEREKTEEELRNSEQRYRELWDEAPVAYHTLDTKGIITNVNKTEAKMLGYQPQEMIGKSIFDFILPEQQAEAKKRFQEKLSEKLISKAESRVYVPKEGSKLYVSIDDALEHDINGKVIGIKTTMVDVTESKRMEEALKESELQYRTTIHSMADPIAVVDADLQIILFNDAFKKRLEEMGLKTDNITGQIFFNVLPFLSDKVRSEYGSVFKSGKTLVTEEYVNIGGREFISEVRKIPIWEDTKVVRILTIMRDITERRKTEETIRQLAYYDALTNLPNRALFNNRLALELNRAQRNKQKASIMLLDLDKFKNVNDTLGHSFGDKLLQDIGKRLTATVRSSDTVSRMGGDEFILLLPEVSHLEDVTKIAEKVLDVLRNPFLINDQKLQITTSIGISIYPDDGEDAETLIKNADIAMYKAKQAGRDKYFLYKVDSK